MPADKIAHYRIIEPLAEGGMGAVYRAHDDRLGREVAIKILKPTGDPIAADRFLREARAASALNHPNIVTVFDAGEAEQGHFIVMELVRGRSVRSVLEQPPDLDTATNLIRQVALALGVAHAARIVHRDIKPENLMVRDDGYVKVVDFGLARVGPHLGSASGVQTVMPTGSHTVIGTLKYMSPEQAMAEDVGPLSDIFSLGIVFYELATGRHPFESESQYGVLNAIVSHRPIPPSRLNAEVSTAVDQLIRRMLEKDPAQRPDAVAVAGALASIGPRPRATATADLAAAGPRRTVGRHKPQAALDKALDWAARGRGLLVCVSGEAGIGKSTFVDDVLVGVAAADDKFHVARGRCSERLAGTEAYLPLLDALEGLVRSDGAVARLMKTIAPLWYAQIAPALLSDSTSEVRKTAAGGTQERLKREFLAFITEVCRQKPLVLFLDDLHWVDLSTVDVLRYLTARFESLPILVIVAYRPEELLAQKHPFVSTKRDLESRSLSRDIVLEFLTRAEVAEYVAITFPNHRLPSDFLDLIHAKTEGSPLFVVEILRFLSDRHVLSRDGDTWRLTRSVPDIARELPDSVRGAIQRKIDALSEDDRRLLVGAAVQGYEFDAAVVARALGVDAADTEERFEALDRIHSLVRRVAERELPDATLTLRYRFVHVLYQNALYGSLTPARRSALSRSMGQALEAFYRHKADVALELAILYEGAREFSRAADFFLVAAKKAADVFAYDEAILVGRRALQALRTLPDEPEQRRRELNVLMTMGLPAMARLGFSNPEVREIYDRAGVLCQEFNETEQFVQILWLLVTFGAVRLELENTQHAADRLRVISEETGSSVAAMHALHGRGLVSYYGGRFEDAVRDFAQLGALQLTLEERRAICAKTGFEPISSACYFRAVARWALGYPDAAVAEIEEGLRLIEEVGYRYAIANMLTFVNLVHFWRGDWARATAANDRMSEIAQQDGLGFYILLGGIFEGAKLAHEGRAEGLGLMEHTLKNLRAIEGRSSHRRWATVLADQLARAGRIDDGLTVLAREIDFKTSAHFWDAELFRMKGELLRLRGGESDRADAEACFERAIQVALELRAKSLELRATSSLASLWHAQGKSREAVARLSAVYEWFAEGFETADLAEARRLLKM